VPYDEAHDAPGRSRTISANHATPEIMASVGAISGVVKIISGVSAYVTSVDRDAVPTLADR